MESTIQFEEKNHAYLTAEILPPLGFRGILDEKLRNAMNTANNLRQNEITLSAGNKKKQMRYDLTFNRSENGTYFFLNKIRATNNISQTEGILDLKSHTFTLYNQRGFDVRQMANLLRGGSVRELVKYKGKKEKFPRWKRLKKNEQGNFIEKTYHESDLNVDYVKQLSTLPLHGSQDDKEKLLKDIYDGELVKAFATVGKEKQEIYLEATPHLADKLTTYDAKMKKIYLTANGIEQGMEVWEEPIAQSQGQAQTVSAGDGQQPGETTPPTGQMETADGEATPADEQKTITPTGDGILPNQTPPVEHTGEENAIPAHETTPTADLATSDPTQLKPDGTTAPAGTQDNPASTEKPTEASKVLPQNENDAGKKAPEVSPTTVSLLEGPQKTEKELKHSKKNKL